MPVLGDSSMQTQSSDANQLAAEDPWIGMSAQELYDCLSDELFDFNASDLGLPLHRTDTGTERLSLHFLESFTRDNGFVASFDCGTEEQRLLVKSTYESNPKHDADTEDYLLVLKSAEIVALVKEVTVLKPRNSAVSLSWNSDTAKSCLEFFSTHRLRFYLELYWALWHPNVNYMHKPSFDIGMSKPGLVAAMAVIGACVSPDGYDKEQASMWFNCVEEVVFQDDDFCYDTEDDGGQRVFPSKARLQSIQAAYMVCLYQNWEGAKASRRRIRRFRYSTLVAVVRDIGIGHARHPDYSVLPSTSFAWHEYLVREQLIRTFLWVFLLDTAFVIFNNVPPRMAMKEMKMGFASSETNFQAVNKESCFEGIRHDTMLKTGLISSVVEKMCKAAVSLEEQSSLADLGPLNLFVLTSALHSMIFQHQQTFAPDAHLMPVRNALESWFATWQLYQQDLSAPPRHCPLREEAITPHNMWKRIGFVRYCSEYWLLAKLITERISAGTWMSDGFNQAGNELHRQGDSVTVLDKYDETSMQQVNDLISQFQQVII